MKIPLSLIVLLYLGFCFSDEEAEVEDAGDNPPEDLGLFEDNLSGHEIFSAILNLASGDNMTPEEAGEALSNSNNNESQGLSVDKKFFFWPWGWGWGWGGWRGCRKQICYSIGSIALIPVCGYDVTLGYRSFRNSCFLNATNTCYQTNYVLNRTGLC